MALLEDMPSIRVGPVDLDAWAEKWRQNQAFDK